jgi:predicted lipoprotein with Yx(FWY)xxD motif
MMQRPKLLPTRRSRVLAALTAALLVLPAFALGSPVLAQSGASCADSITSAPTGPATVSTAKTAFGRVLVVGSGEYAGCSLYLLTSDQLHALTGAPYACSDDPNALGAACDTILWPALLTAGAPVAGPGVNPTLLGTVTRDDLPGLGSVQQVTYAGYPLYRFIFDETPGEVEGANLFDPVTSPTGNWYLVDANHGRPATGRAELQLETAPVNGGSSATVLSVTMDNDFSLASDGATFPVYTLSTDGRAGRVKTDCQAACAATYWPPVLTTGRPIAGPGVDQQALGIIVRPDGTHQVTYQGRPLYLFFGDAYLPTIPAYNDGVASINGDGLSTPWGVFDTIPPLG